MNKCDKCRRTAKLTPIGSFDLCDECLDADLERMEKEAVEAEMLEAMFD